MSIGPPALAACPETKEIRVTYYPDLSPYSFLPGKVSVPAANVGWLDKEYPFSRGPISTKVVDRIWLLCLRPTNQTRGYHTCSLCDSKSLSGVRMSVDGVSRTLGGAEIHVRASSGVTYVAPDLIYHYITQHGYAPPMEFLEAVESQAIE